MADLSLVTADQVNIQESLDQHTMIAAAAVTAGDVVYFDATTGKFTKANAADATAREALHIAGLTRSAGLGLTALRRGYMDGWDLSGMDYGAKVYLSSNAGKIADASPAQNSIQVVTLGGAATGGTFTLSFGGQTTSALAYNASAATVEAALEALSTIGTGNVSVSGSAGGPYTVEFIGDLANRPQSAITGSGASLTDTTEDVTVAVATAGARANEVQTVTLTGSPTGGTFTLTYGGQTTAAIAYDAAASAVESALEAISSIPTGAVAVTGADGGPWTVYFLDTLGVEDIALMTASGASLTGGSSPDVEVAEATAGAGANEQVTLTYAGTPTGGTFTVTFGGEETAALAYNISPADLQTALEALSSIGEGNILVTGSAGAWVLTFADDLAFENVGAVTTDAALLTGDAEEISVAESQAGIWEVELGYVVPVSSNLIGSDPDKILHVGV